MERNTHMPLCLSRSDTAMTNNADFGYKPCVPKCSSRALLSLGILPFLLHVMVGGAAVAVASTSSRRSALVGVEASQSTARARRLQGKTSSAGCFFGLGENLAPSCVFLPSSVCGLGDNAAVKAQRVAHSLELQRRPDAMTDRATDLPD